MGAGRRPVVVLERDLVRVDDREEPHYPGVDRRRPTVPTDEVVAEEDLGTEPVGSAGARSDRDRRPGDRLGEGNAGVTTAVCHRLDQAGDIGGGQRATRPFQPSGRLATAWTAAGTGDAKVRTAPRRAPGWPQL